MRTKILSAVLVVALSWSCAPAARVETGPSSEAALKLDEARAQIARGCYVGFRNAIRLYQELYAKPALRGQIASPYLSALLLMMIRGREAGVLDSALHGRAAAVIREAPSLRALLPFFDLAEALPFRSRGFMQDLDPAGLKPLADGVLAQVRADLRARAPLDDYSAYLYLAFFTGYGNYPTPEADFIKDLLVRFPQSTLMSYKSAIQARLNGDALRALIAAEPEFYEAWANLGELALGRQDILEAERCYLKAYDGIPESSQVTVYLAGIYTATEEYEKSLEFYDKTLALSPEYRDALLGKGICLSSMGRYEDALAPLSRIVELGYYMLGESHYWLAWNYHALKNDARAEAEIEESKPRLPTNSEVYALSGTIALDLGKLDKAEKEFTESLRHNESNIEALFGLGTVATGREKWKAAGGFYETAAGLLEKNEAALADKMDQIRKSSLSDERKARMLAKKEQQLKINLATKATALYNGAASYFNAAAAAGAAPDLKTKAADMAARAAAHPQFKDKAAELLKKIKQ